MNRVILIGNLATDVEYRITQAQISVASFRLAVQRKYQNAAGTHDADFVPVVAWRGVADSAAKYLTKGKKIAIDGCLQVRSYDDDAGNRKYITEIVAESIEFLSPAERGEHSGYENGAADCGENRG